MLDDLFRGKINFIIIYNGKKKVLNNKKQFMRVFVLQLQIIFNV